MVIALGFYISKKDKQTEKEQKCIREELARENRESFGRLEGILVKLIDAQKGMQINQSEIKAKIGAIIEIMASLSGNGLKEKFVRKDNDRGW